MSASEAPPDPGAGSEGPPVELRARVEATVGPCRFRLVHAGRHTGSCVWCVEGATARFALKVHATREGHHRERVAYEEWLPSRASSAGAPARIAPRFVAGFEGPPPALLLSWAPGTTLLEMRGLTVPEELAIYEEAGRAVRALHAAPVATDAGRSLPDVLRARIRRRVDLLRDVLPTGVAPWALRIADSAAWEGLRTGPCHRDSSPRNWVVSPPSGPSVTLIDFEHAEVDFLATDAMKLWDGPFVGRPELRDAFYAGYGCAVEDALEEVRLLAPAHGLSIVDWSRRSGDSAYEAHGLAFLARAARHPAWPDA